MGAVRVKSDEGREEKSNQRTEESAMWTTMSLLLGRCIAHSKDQKLKRRRKMSKSG
jgi:hypothetical protein